MAVSDVQINSRIRAVLARHWIDLRTLRFGSFRGAVRVTGVLTYLGRTNHRPGETAELEVLEREIRRVPGVRRVGFQLENWKRDGDGAWRCTSAGVAPDVLLHADESEGRMVEP